MSMVCAIEPEFDPNNHQHNTLVSNYYCKYCGSKASIVSSLTSNTCARHTDGSTRGSINLHCESVAISESIDRNYA